MFVFQVGGVTELRYIVSFPTKKHWRGKSRNEYVCDGLKALVAEVKRPWSVVPHRQGELW